MRPSARARMRAAHLAASAGGWPPVSSAMCLASRFVEPAGVPGRVSPSWLVQDGFPAPQARARVMTIASQTRATSVASSRGSASCRSGDMPVRRHAGDAAGPQAGCGGGVGVHVTFMCTPTPLPRDTPLSAGSRIRRHQVGEQEGARGEFACTPSGAARQPALQSRGSGGIEEAAGAVVPLHVRTAARPSRQVDPVVAGDRRVIDMGVVRPLRQRPDSIWPSSMRAIRPDAELRRSVPGQFWPDAGTSHHGGCLTFILAAELDPRYAELRSADTLRGSNIRYV